MAKYRCDAVTTTDDGSGNVRFDVLVLDDEGSEINNGGFSSFVPFDLVSEALAGANSANSLKNLVMQYGPKRFRDKNIANLLMANDNAALATDEVNSFVDGIGGLPVSFNL